MLKIAARVTVNGQPGTVIRKTQSGLWRVRLDSGVEVSLSGRNLEGKA